jgi:hypothetical protein
LTSLAWTVNFKGSFKNMANVKYLEITVTNKNCIHEEIIRVIKSRWMKLAGHAAYNILV